MKPADDRQDDEECAEGERGEAEAEIEREGLLSGRLHADPYAPERGHDRRRRDHAADDGAVGDPANGRDEEAGREEGEGDEGGNRSGAGAVHPREISSIRSLRPAPSDCPKAAPAQLIIGLGVAAIVACGGRGPRHLAGDDASDPLAASSLMNDVARLTADEMRGRGSYQPGAAIAANFVASELAAIGLDVIRQDVRGGAQNIIGIKSGGPLAVIVSAHHDHLGKDSADTIFPGADDNASGVAVLLGIARSRRQADYAHTVLFISFGAEEDGLVGSNHYVHHPLWPLSKTLAVVNFDMVGRNFFEAGTDREAAAAVIGLEGDPVLLRATERAAAAAGLRLVSFPARLLELFGLDDRTDDWWFRRQDIPSIHFSTGLHDDYHRSSDTLEKLVPAQLERIARTAASVLDVVASRPRGQPEGGDLEPRAEGP